MIEENEHEPQEDTTLFIRNKEVWKDGEIPKELNEPKSETKK